MPGPSPVVQTRLKEPLHERFRAEAAARGLTESELLRMAVIRFLDGKPTEPGEVQAEADEAELKRKTVWMPAFLMKAAEERAAKKGMSFSRWVSSLVQSNLMRQPVLSDIEVSTVEASNRELAAIGRNINQIARALNEAYFQTERVRLDRLAELSAQISKTRESISSLIRASRNAWRAE